MKAKAKNILINTAIFMITLLLCFGAAEMTFRWMIFGENKKFTNLRNPGDYADWNSEYVYWYLLTKWNLNGYLPAFSIPLIGWVTPRYNGLTFEHTDDKAVGEKRPVLLYGDSFSSCVDSTVCFDEFLNADSSFSQKHHLLNFGTGGFGVDQIQLLMSQTVDRYNKPFVVFAFLTFDLDRSILPFRDSSKPYYTIENDSLLLHTEHLKQTPAQFVADNSPGATSYLWRKLLYMQGESDGMRKYHKIMQKFIDYKIDKKIALNTLILDKALAKLKSSKCDYVFLIFSCYDDFITPPGENWRENFIKEYTTQNHVPVIWTKDIMHRNLKNNDDIVNFFIPVDGHPTSNFNRLISEELVRYVEKSSLE